MSLARRLQKLLVVRNTGAWAHMATKKKGSSRRKSAATGGVETPTESPLVQDTLPPPGMRTDDPTARPPRFATLRHLATSYPLLTVLGVAGLAVAVVLASRD